MARFVWLVAWVVACGAASAAGTRGSRVSLDVDEVELAEVVQRLAEAGGPRLVAHADAAKLSVCFVGERLSRGAAVAQHFFVNGRPVRDKLLVGALRGAYADFLSRDRHGVPESPTPAAWDGGASSYPDHLAGDDASDDAGGFGGIGVYET